jgi:regulator of replication initiation timing
MSDLVTLVSGIEFKIRELTDRNDTLKRENQLLLEENKVLKSTIEEDKLNIKQLEYRNQVIKITKVLEGKKGSSKAKQQLNELLREVDRCIGLLND